MSENKAPIVEVICGNCVYCRETENRDLNDISKGKEYACFRYPPSSASTPVQTAQGMAMVTSTSRPVISVNGPGCGEFKQIQH